MITDHEAMIYTGNCTAETLRSIKYQTPVRRNEKEKLNFLMDHYSKFQREKKFLY